MSVIKIGDQFKEYLFSDRRDTTKFDFKIGIVKSVFEKNGVHMIIINFEKRGQLKVTSELEINNIEKNGDFWVRK